MSSLFSALRRVKPSIYVILLVLIAVAAFLWNKQSAEKMKAMQAMEAAKTAAAAPEDANALLSAVGKLMTLPTDEPPVILEIKDPALLIAQQAFFTGSAAGDKLLVYQKNLKAIIYSPTRNIIVNSGPVNLDTAAVTGAQSKATTTKATTTKATTKPVEKK